MAAVYATNPHPPDNTSLFLWGGILIVVAIIGLSAVLAVKRYISRTEGPSVSPGFTLKDLEQMHLEGKLSDQEYERAKARMIASVRATGTSTPPRSG